MGTPDKRHTKTHGSLNIQTITDVSLDQKRVNVFEHPVKKCHVNSYEYIYVYSV